MINVNEVIPSDKAFSRLGSKQNIKVLGNVDKITLFNSDGSFKELKFADLNWKTASRIKYFLEDINHEGSEAQFGLVN